MKKPNRDGIAHLTRDTEADRAATAAAEDAEDASIEDHIEKAEQCKELGACACVHHHPLLLFQN